jgi:hypothetical protein
MTAEEDLEQLKIRMEDGINLLEEWVKETTHEAVDITAGMRLEYIVKKDLLTKIKELRGLI